MKNRFFGTPYRADKKCAEVSGKTILLFCSLSPELSAHSSNFMHSVIVFIMFSTLLLSFIYATPFQKMCPVFRIEYYVARHYGDKIFSFTYVDDIMHPTGNHCNPFDFISASSNSTISPVVTFHSCIKSCPATTMKYSHFELCQCCPFVMPGFEIFIET